MAPDPARPFDWSRLWLAASVVGLAAGGILYATVGLRAAEVAWAATTVIGILPMGREVIGGLIRREPGVDLIALIAMVTALVLGQYLAGAVIALMLATGVALENYAERRAHQELSSLLERAPRAVTRYEDGELVGRPVDEVACS
jgi:cation transport ATPase